MEETPGEKPTGQVKPLAPRDVGEIMSETFRIYRRHFWKVVVVGGFAAVLFEIVWHLLAPRLGVAPGAGSDLASLRNNPLALGVSMGLRLAAHVFSYGALVWAVSEQVIRGDMDIGRAFRFGLRRLAPMAAAALVTSLACALMAITLIGIPVAVFFGVCWKFVLEAVAVEGARPLNAVGRSAQLVRGQWWRVFGIILLMALLGVAVMVVLSFIPEIGDVIGGILGMPIIVIGSVLLYYDLRVRKEGYTLEKLARDLGYDTPFGPSDGTY